MPHEDCHHVWLEDDVNDYEDMWQWRVCPRCRKIEQRHGIEVWSRKKKLLRRDWYDWSSLLLSPSLFRWFNISERAEQAISKHFHERMDKTLDE